MKTLTLKCMSKYFMRNIEGSHYNIYQKDRDVIRRHFTRLTVKMYLEACQS